MFPLVLLPSAFLALLAVTNYSGFVFACGQCAQQQRHRSASARTAQKNHKNTKQDLEAESAKKYLFVSSLQGKPEADGKPPTEKTGLVDGACDNKVLHWNFDAIFALSLGFFKISRHCEIFLFPQYHDFFLIWVSISIRSSNFMFFIFS